VIRPNPCLRIHIGKRSPPGPSAPRIVASQLQEGE
jgi:hypothetical protein